MDHAKTQIRRRLAGDSVHACQSARGRRRLAAVEGHALEERLQDLRAGHGRAARRHGQRGGPLSRGLQEVAAGDGRRHAGGDCSRSSFAPYSIAAAASAFAARAGRVRPADAAALRWPAARHYYRADRLGRGVSTKIAAKLRGTPADETSSYVSGRCFERSRLPAAALRPALRHQQRQQLLVLLPSGQRRRPWPASLGTGTATVQLEDVEHADLCLPHRRQPGEQPSAADAHADARPPPRRRRSSSSIRSRKSAWSTSACRATLRSLLFGTEIASLYVQPHIGGDIALLDRRRQAHARARSARSSRFSTNTADGWPDFRRQVEATDWDEIEAQVGRRRAPRSTHAADDMPRPKNVVFGWTMGITHHAARRRQRARRSSTWRCCAAWSAGRAPGCCRSAATRNVQGIGSVGVTPKLKEAIFERLETHFGVQAADDAGPRHDGLHGGGRGRAS